jgi:hypothetical protein
VAVLLAHHRDSLLDREERAVAAESPETVIQRGDDRLLPRSYDGGRARH